MFMIGRCSGRIGGGMEMRRDLDRRNREIPAGLLNDVAGKGGLAGIAAVA